MPNKRIYQLDLETNATGSSIPLDVSGNAEAKRILFDNLLSSSNVRYGSQAITEGAQVITFSSAFADANYILIADVRDTNGFIVGNELTNKLLSGFTINPAFDSTLNYIAIKIWKQDIFFYYLT